MTRRRLATTEPLPPDADISLGDDAEGGCDADEPEKGPLRRCIVTRERLAKELMIRFVVLPPDAEAGRKLALVIPDLTATLPGRGIWLSARRDVLEAARTRGGFARAARCQVMVAPDLASGLAASLTRRVGETLGLARRAGQAVAGYSKAREWLEGGRAGLVVQASDGSPEERQRFLSGWNGRVPAVAPLDAAQLGGVFGRDHIVHVALLRGRLADRVRVESGRLDGVRNTLPAVTKVKDDAPGAAGGMVRNTGG